MTDPNLTPRADKLSDAGRLRLRDAIAHELKGTPLVGVLVETSYDWATDTTVIRARVGITIEGAFKLDRLAAELDDRDAYLNAHARRMGQDMRREWEKLTGEVERRSTLRQAIIDLTFAVGERDHESRDRRLEGVIARLEGLAR